MKRTLIPVLMLLLLLAGCRQKPSLPNTTAAAWELYQHYADLEDITVAFLGDYSADSCTYDMVMFHTSDSVAFEQLMVTFGLRSVEVVWKMRNQINKVKDSVLLYSYSYHDSIKLPSGDGKRKVENPLTQSALNIHNEFDTMTLSFCHYSKGTDSASSGKIFLKQLSIKYPLVHSAIWADCNNCIIFIFFYDSQEQYENLLKSINY